MAAQTVIGFFDNHSDAQRAIEKLQSRGITRDRIDLSTSGTGMGTSSSNSSVEGVNPVSGSTRDENSVARTSDDRTVDREGRNTNRFTDFFNNLFGSDKDDADRYSKVAANCSHIVTVHAQTGDEAEKAADILDDAGAVDVDERASKLGYTNTRSQGVGMRTNVSNERGGMRSRIVERRIDEHVRLRGEDRDLNHLNTGTRRSDTDLDDATSINRGI